MGDPEATQVQIKLKSEYKQFAGTIGDFATTDHQFAAEWTSQSQLSQHHLILRLDEALAKSALNRQCCHKPDSVSSAGSDIVSLEKHNFLISQSRSVH